MMKKGNIKKGAKKHQKDEFGTEEESEEYNWDAEINSAWNTKTINF